MTSIKMADEISKNLASLRVLYILCGYPIFRWHVELHRWWSGLFPTRKRQFLGMWGVDRRICVWGNATLLWRHIRTFRRLIALTSQLFGQKFILADKKETIKTLHAGAMPGFHRWLVDSQHKGPIMRKMWPCHDVIMVCCICYGLGLVMFCCVVVIWVFWRQGRYLWHG